MWFWGGCWKKVKKKKKIGTAQKNPSLFKYLLIQSNLLKEETKYNVFLFCLNLLCLIT